MGYNIDRFPEPVDEELKCPICCGVLEDPIQSMNCEHVYCNKCIREWLQTSSTCPVDREALSSKQLGPIPRIVRNLLNHLLIKCQFSGCMKTIHLSQLVSHESSCNFNPSCPVPCPNDCGAPVSKNQNHDCIRELRALIINQQKELEELRALVGNLTSTTNEQRNLAKLNNSSLEEMADKYEFLSRSIDDLEKPIKEIVSLAERLDKNEEMRNILMQETTIEIYLANLDRGVTVSGISDHLAQEGIKVVDCKNSLSRGWKNDFRLTIFKMDTSKVLQGKIWPRGVSVFVCGDYYGTRIDGECNRSDLQACVQPWYYY